MNMAFRASALVLLAFPLLLVGCNRGENGGGHVFGGRTPTFKYVKETEGGCADVLLFKATADKREYLMVHADKKKLNLPLKGSKTIDIADAGDGFGVSVGLWATAPKFDPYCNCVTDNNLKESTWTAKKGKATFTLQEPEPGQEGPMRRYKVTVRFENVIFESESGQQATLKDETITDVLCGWYAG